MRSLVLTSVALSALLVAAGPTAGETSGAAAEKGRWLPEACVLELRVERASTAGDGEPQEGDEARWNRFYRLGIGAIGIRDLERARVHFCQALEAARSFGPRDVRFAETLDELGLVNYLSGDDETAEAMQGAATAEMLLALGPPEGDLAETAEADCRSSVASYMVRLGWIFDRQGRPGKIDALLRAPHRILGRGYIPTDSFSGRLDWLIAQYLLAEDFAAADWLSSLRDEASDRR